MIVRQHRSKWQVVGANGKRFRATFGTRSQAEAYKELCEAWNAWANGWNRLTERQKELINVDLVRRGKLPITEGEANAS